MSKVHICDFCRTILDPEKQWIRVRPSASSRPVSYALSYLNANLQPARKEIWGDYCRLGCLGAATLRTQNAPDEKPLNLTGNFFFPGEHPDLPTEGNKP